jgi:hypothetical protein
VTHAWMLKEDFVIEAVFGFCAITVEAEETVEHRKCITRTYNTA